MIPKPSKIRGLGVVRNADGYIRCNNYAKLSREDKAILREMVRKDGFITADSYPNVDERFLEK